MDALGNFREHKRSVRVARGSLASWVLSKLRKCIHNSTYAQCIYIDLAKPKSGVPQLFIFFGILLLMEIIPHVCEANCEQFYTVAVQTRITSADRGVKWCDDENRAMISWEGLQGSHQKS